MARQFVIALLVVLFTICAAAVRGQEVFVERFEGAAPGERWQLQSDLDPPGLRWQDEGEQAGFHFEAVAVEKYIKSHDYAWAQWEVGTQPFELSWEVQLDRALRQRWFYPGVAVGLTSAPPGKMGEEDIAVTIGVHMGGMAASARKGGFFDLRTEGHGAYSNFRDRVLSSGLIDRSSGGTASADWPVSNPGGSRVRFHIRRNEDHTLEFAILWPELPGEHGRPYWTGQWQMPDEVAQVPLRYICVKRVPVLSVHVNYSGFVMRGVVSDIQGRLLSAARAPVVRGFSPQQPVLAGGGQLILEGENFQQGGRVVVGGKDAAVVRVPSAQEILCTLPDLPPQNRYPLSVTNPNGLAADLDGGVPYGRMLEALRPREALPAGGDVVTVLGAGFEKDTLFTIGGKPAEVVELIDPGRAKLSVPAGAAGPAGVAACTGEAAFAGEPEFGYAPHPYLYFRAEDLPALREKFKLPMFRHYRERLLHLAEQSMESEKAGGLDAAALSITYALTQESRYKRAAIELARRCASQTEYTDFHMMGVAGMAIAYDVLFAELSPEDRAAFEEYLLRMLDGYLKVAPGSWFFGAGPNFSNTVPVGNSGGMLAGLALMHSTPRAAQAVDIAAQKARRYADECISPDGACREGVQYWDYGLSFYLILAHALKNATGDDRGLLDHPHLENNVNFIRAQLGGHGGLFAFNDTREPWLDGHAICADLGSRYHQPLMLWVADRAAKGGEKTRARETWAPFAFLWRSDEPAPEDFPGVPTLAYLQDMHWGAMRSDGSFMPQLVVGVKGSRGPLTHHKQNDLGSYVVQANGEEYLVDPGYYEGKATDHTLPLIDGEGPDVTGSSITAAWEQGPWRHITIDSTDGYGQAAQRVRRLLVMYGAECVVVLDDIVPAKGKPGTITAQYQTAWPPRIDERAKSIMLLHGQKGVLRVQCYGPPIELAAQDRTFRHGWHWEKLEEGPGDWHTVSGTYTAELDRPLVTVCQPARSGKRLPPRPECDYSNGAVTVEFAGDVTVRFERTPEGWQFVRP